MAKSQVRRTKYFVDSKVQGALLIRIVVYWVLCLWAVYSILAGVPIVMGLVFFSDPPAVGEILLETFVRFWPMGCAALLLLPLAMHDLIRQTHRFAGPLLRLQNEMKRLADGEEVAPVMLRKGDRWTEVVEEFNRLSAEVQELRELKAALKDDGAASEAESAESSVAV